MKKFNTILAIAAVALTSVFGLSSCEKNDEIFEQPVQPRIERHTEITNVPTGNNESTSESKTAVTVKDVIGTYKYTSEDGKEWVIEMTENPGDNENQYSASITVPEGTEVAAKTYDGEFKILKDKAFFYSTETIGNIIKVKVVSFMLEVNQNNPENTNVSILLNSEHRYSFVFAKQ